VTGQVDQDQTALAVKDPEGIDDGTPSSPVERQAVKQHDRGSATVVAGFFARQSTELHN
jgi:hypothetical protein